MPTGKPFDWRSDGELPPVTAKVRRWFHFRVMEHLRPRVANPTRREVVTWLDSNLEDYLVWVPDERLSPAWNQPGGSWYVSTGAIDRDLPKILAEVQGKAFVPSPAPAAPAPPPPVVPATEADVDAALAYTGSAPEEPNTYRFLPSHTDQTRHDERCKMYERFRRTSLAAARLRRDRRCVCCREFFKAKADSAASCDACKAAGRRLCIHCGTEFHTETGKARRCPACLETAAKIEAMGEAARKGDRP